MVNVIQGLVDRSGEIVKGSGFKVKEQDYGYEITFPNLNQVPTVIGQAGEIDDAITCVTVATLPNPVKVLMATLSPDGEFRKNAFAFIAVSND
ncbi:MAG: hypothetical protein AAF383_00490 [Cyanobacteria bacterium P01_A01_bin.83]